MTANERCTSMKARRTTTWLLMLCPPHSILIFSAAFQFQPTRTLVPHWIDEMSRTEFPLQHRRTKVIMQESNRENHKLSKKSSTTTTSSIKGTRRRLFIAKAIGGLAVFGIVANKIAIDGPEPYQPPPNSLRNKIIAITGGNTGLGLESAKRLSSGGATVVITSRNVDKGARAVTEVKNACEENGVTDNNIFLVQLDLCDLSNVKSFPTRLQRTIGVNKKIDVLLNNAGKNCEGKCIY